jgi:hypothetical protein
MVLTEKFNFHVWIDTKVHLVTEHEAGQLRIKRVIDMYGGGNNVNRLDGMTAEYSNDSVHEQNTIS